MGKWPNYIYEWFEDTEWVQSHYRLYNCVITDCAIQLHSKLIRHVVFLHLSKKQFHGVAQFCWVKGSTCICGSFERISVKDVDTSYPRVCILLKQALKFFYFYAFFRLCDFPMMQYCCLAAYTYMYMYMYVYGFSLAIFWYLSRRHTNKSMVNIKMDDRYLSWWSNTNHT